MLTVEESPEATPQATPEPAPSPEPAAHIELLGGEELDWLCGREFVDPGFIALDKMGNDMSGQTQISGKVICWKVGDYALEYSFTDENGETVSCRRNGHVVPVGVPETVKEEKVIYLTFDDGPCKNTREVLEILDKYDAKATFFVVLGNEKYLDILPEIKEAGHSLGIHAYKHNYDSLYMSERRFFEDFVKAQQILYEYTGEYADISRFPGGGRTAKGNLSHKIEGGMAGLEQRLADMGVRYYDWNLQIEDSRNGSTENTCRNFCSWVSDKEVPISLQHDTRAYSIKALEKMLQWGIENGYTFKAMDNTVPPVHFYDK